VEWRIGQWLEWYPAVATVFKAESEKDAQDHACELDMTEPGLE
jgi:hypothetical protein